MTKLNWNDTPKRSYEYGVDRGVFYPKNGIGTSWNGLASVKEVTDNASQSLIFIDGVGHQNQLLIGSFAATIEAMTYPVEFEPFDGYSGIYSAQGRRPFDFCYRTMQADGDYKIHIVYNAIATPTQRNHSTLSYNMDVELFSWNLSTRPELIPDAKSSAHFVVDTTQVNPGLVEDLEARLYGTEDSLASMPTVTELLWIFEENAVFRVTDNGDGTATISGPDSAVQMLNATTAQLMWPSVIFVGNETYQISSL